jgi:RNA polymerase sigma-70 factor (ECF subfamily)
MHDPDPFPVKDAANETLEPAQVNGEAASASDAEQELQRALGQLPRAQLAALLLHKRDGLTVPEIARQLDVPVDTIKSRIAHALAVCRSSVRKGRPARSGGKAL